jgi:glycosyltransferase involved in cell wall biosynthesis/LmbE family N-acetylglucosaminyl deacetylase
MAIANEQALFSTIKTAFPPVRKALVIAPHPDDEVFGCGGTLSLLRSGGCMVTIIIVTNGALGDDSVDGKLIEIRAGESRAAAKLLGLDAPIFWGLPDRGVSYGEILIARLIEAIAEFDADLVFLPSPSDWHPDHQAIAFAGAEAIRRLGGLRQAAFYEVTDPLPNPSLIHDISAVEALKHQAMRCFPSQLQEQPYDSRISGINNFRALHLGAQVKSAEAFSLLSATELDQGLPILLDGPLATRRNLGFAATGSDMPLVSVIIRSMNRPTLIEALDSLALQTYSNIEVVLVNAKGSDHQEIDQWRGRFPVRMMGTGERIPRSRAANMGLDAAHGEYLMFLDDDDWFEAGHIQKLVAAITQHPEFKVAYTGVKCVDERKNLLANKFDTPFDAVQLVAGNFIPIHAVLFTRGLLELGCRLDESLDLYEDWDFWIQLSRHGDFLKVDGLSAVYRITQQTGFGVSADPVVAEQAALVLYKKWLNRLPGRQITGLMQAVRNNPIKDGHIANPTQAAAERDGRIANLTQAIAERDGRIANLTQAAAERDGHIANLTQAIAERDGHIANLTQAAAERDGLAATVKEMCESKSWRITAPLRFVGRQIKRARRVVELTMPAIRRGGGLKNTFNKAIRLYRREGLAGIRRGFRIVATTEQTIPSPGSSEHDINDYAEWIRRYDTLTDESRAAMRTRIDGFTYKPLISVVMPVYNPPLNMLEDAIHSVQSQLYPNWELCIADDASTDAGIHKLLQRYADNDSRIKVVFREKNGHISAASNSALELVTGEYVALLDNDDLLPEQALFWVADAIVANPGAGLIYSDEDKVNQSGRRYDPYFKPDWNPDLFLSHNMICHLGAYRTDLVRQLGGFREGYEGAQDYDLALRCTEQLAPLQIVHIPRVLYHWRSHLGSTAQAGSEKNYALLAGERALNDHFARAQVSAKAELLDFGMYRARYAVPSPAPLVSLIIPTRNGLKLIKQCIDSILAKTTYNNYEILVVDNNSDDPNTLAYFASLAENNRIRVLRDERTFNYSALNNAAAQEARGEYLCLVNNDIEVISPEWLDEMMGLAIQPGVGVVGARLWYPNDTLQHGGCITGIGGVAGHSHKRLPRNHMGYFARAQLIQTLSVVTAACLVVKKSLFQKVGGLDETNLKVAFNDVDFCLRVREAGYRNVWTPYAELYHHESATRGHEDTPEKKLRFKDEVLYMQNRWGELLMKDPAYSPNLTLDREDFSYAWPPRTAQI